MLTKTESQSHIDHVIELLQEKIAARQADLVWCQDSSERDRVKIRLQERIASLRLMQIIENIPSSLQFFMFEASKITRETRLKRRFDFESAGERHLFLSHVFSDSASQKNLEVMGFSIANIQHYMKNGLMLKLEDGSSYDLTVDHIVDLTYGGTNDLSNLCILPYYVNKTKSDLVNLQYSLELPNVMSFRPAPSSSGKHVYVPLIPGGFGVLTKDPDALRICTETLLNIEPKTEHEPSRPNILTPPSARP